MAGRGTDGTERAGERSAAATSRLAWTIAIFAMMVVFGAANMVRGPVIPELGSDFGAAEWQLGLIAPSATVGYLVAVSVVGFGAGHFEPRRLIVGGLVGNALVMFALGAAPMLPLFLVAVALQGAMIGAVRAINRPLLSHFYPSRRGRVFGYYDMIWAVGAALAPLLVLLALRFGEWRHVYWTLGAVLVALTLHVLRLEAPSIEQDEEPFTRGDVLDLLRRPEVLAMAAVMFFATGVEGGLFLWLPTYAAGELPAALASVTLTMFVGAYVPGRFVVGRLADRVGHLPLLGCILGAMVPVFLWTFVLASGLGVLPGIVGLGLLACCAFPLLTSYATDAAPEYSGPVTAIAAVSSSLGIGVVPALMGVAISGSDAATGMQLLLIPLVLALLLVTWAGLSERRREESPAGVSQPAD